LIKLCILAVVIFVVFHRRLTPFVIEKAAGQALGTRVEVGSVEFDYLNTAIDIRDVVIRNPRGFPDGAVAVIPSLGVDLDAGKLFSGQFEFEEVGIVAADIRLLRSPPNGLNLLALKIFRRDTPDDNMSQAAPREAAGPLIQTLRLTVGRVTLTDLSGPLPTQHSFNLRIENLIFHDVRGMGDIADVLASEVLRGVGLDRWLPGALGLEREPGILSRIAEFFKGGGGVGRETAVASR
jgi:hypothetical protein